MELVCSEGGHLVVGGKPFRAVLVNAYYLQEEAARGRRDLVDETFAACVAMGVGVVRAWAFNDDPAKADTGIQRDKLIYSPLGLTGLDRVLERARAFGLRLVLPLVNHWNAYGGARQYLLWNGVGDAREGDVRFFTDGRVRAHWAAHVTQLLQRTNPLTGFRYAEDPVVLAWELMNEPRGRGLPPAGPGSLVEWVRFAAGTVRSAGARQLISVGDEVEENSFENGAYDPSFWKRVDGEHLFSPKNGGSFARFLEVDDVDLGSCHFYPEKYGLTPGAEAEAGCAWIEGHAAVAHARKKPLLVGEFGMIAPSRLEAYRRWLRAAEHAEVAAIGPWLFCYRSRPALWDEFTFYDDDPIARLLADAAARLRDYSRGAVAPPPSR